MEYALPILLLIASFGLMITEVFLPSFGILTVLSLGCLAGSVVLGFGVSETLGYGLVGTAIVGIPILLFFSFKVFPHTGLGRHMILLRPETPPRPVSRFPGQDLVGREGRARSFLRPSGTASFGGERVDVVTRGEMIPAGTRIRVIESSGNRLVVQAIEDLTTTEEEPKEETL